MTILVDQTDNTLTLEIPNNDPDHDLREFYTRDYLRMCGLEDSTEVYFHQGVEGERTDFRESLVEYGGYFQPTDELTEPYKEFVNIVEGEWLPWKQNSKYPELNKKQSWMQYEFPWEKTTTETQKPTKIPWFTNKSDMEEEDATQKKLYREDESKPMDSILSFKHSFQSPIKIKTENDSTVKMSELKKDMDDKEDKKSVFTFKPVKISSSKNESSDKNEYVIKEEEEKDENTKMTLPKQEYIVLKFTLFETTLEEPHGKVMDFAHPQDYRTNIELNSDGLYYSDLLRIWNFKQNMSKLFPETKIDIYQNELYRINGKLIAIKSNEIENTSRIDDLDFETGLNGTWLHSLVVGEP